jgi:hypothetical protein
LADDNASPQDQHALYVRQFEEAEQAGLTGRRESEKARDYFDGRQFTAAEEKRLRRRKQPITPINLVRSKIEACCGLERQTRTDPKAYSRVPSKEDDANAVTDALRYVSDDQDIDIKKSAVFQNMLVEGFGGIECTVKQLRNGVVDPYVVQIEWERLYYDPHSARLDFSDAAYKGYVTWMDADQAKLRWPEAAAIIDSTMSKCTSGTWDNYDDKPKWSYWSDSKRNRVRINTHYHLVEGVWHRCVFTLAGELEPSAPSMFLDEEGNPECPLIMQSAYVDRDNDRYGIMRDMIPIQDGINKRHSKALHALSNTRVRASRTVGTDKNVIREEMARADGVIFAENGEIQELGNGAEFSGQLALLQELQAQLKGNIGPNAYLSGKQGGDQSGKAILAQQQAGMTELTPMLDGLRHLTLRLYRQIWNRIRQFWTAERWIRVTDDEKNVRFVGLNTPPELSPQQAQIGAMKVQAAVAQGIIDQATAQQYLQQIQSMASVGNHLAELDVDVDIDEVQDTPTLQLEQYNDLMQLLSSSVLPMTPPMIRLVIQASTLRNKDKLLDIVDQMEKQAQQPNPANEIAMREKQAGVTAKQAGAIKDQADARLATARAMQIGMSIGGPPPIHPAFGG